MFALISTSFICIYVSFNYNTMSLKVFLLSVICINVTITFQHKAMVVAADGCYEYHMNHQDTLDYANNLAALTVRQFKIVAIFFKNIFLYLN